MPSEEDLGKKIDTATKAGDDQREVLPFIPKEPYDVVACDCKSYHFYRYLWKRLSIYRILRKVFVFICENFR